jgi:hypothetical protein
LVGSRFEVRPYRGRGFVCEVESAVPEKELRLRYVAGIYRGTGVWVLAAQEGGTRLSYRIDLEIVDWVVALLSYVVNIASLHSRFMKEVLGGLAGYVAGG